MSHNQTPTNQPELEEATVISQKRRRTEPPAVVTLDSGDDQDDEVLQPTDGNEANAPQMAAQGERDEALEGIAEMQARGRCQREKEMADALAAATTRMDEMERQVESLKQTVEENGSQTAQLKQQNDRLDSEIVALKHEVAELTKKLASVGGPAEVNDKSIPTMAGSEENRTAQLEDQTQNEKAEILFLEHLNNAANQLALFFGRQGEQVPRRDLDMRDEHPALAPVFWVSKWVDHSNKYGLSYQLCNDSVGVFFNDNTKLLYDPSGDQLRYIGATGAESFCTATHYAHALEKKVTLLKEFRSHMMKHRLSASEKLPRGCQEFARSPSLSAWIRTKLTIVLMMTDGTLQVNFFADHTKLILSPSMQAVTFIDPQRRPHTYRLQHLADAGCSHELHKRLKYAKTMVDRMLGRGNTKS